MSSVLQHLCFWNLKSHESNNWHPVPGKSPIHYVDGLPLAMKRIDFPAAVVDAAPFVAGAGGLAHISQVHQFGFTAPASIFRNVKTMMAVQRTVVWMTPAILVAQAVGLEYRFLIPRWASERELRRDEEEVRKHVDVGIGLGVAIYAGRIAFRVGRRYWAPLEVILAGALADLMHREYCKAHGL